MSKESIIAKIIGDAEAQRAAERKEAEEKIETRRESARLAADARLAETRKAASALEADLVARRKSVAELEVRKLLLAVKQETLASAFEKAKSAILSLPAEKYTAFLVEMLNVYAEDGETVVLGKEDPVLTQEIASFAMRKNLVLSVRKDGAFRGGMMLEGKFCDKNLTLDTLIKEYREKAEAEIAASLFGEDV